MGVSPFSLDVATFNIRNGWTWDGLNSWWLRRRSTAAAIARLGVDVIGLQEVYRFQRRYLARRIGGQWVGVGREDGDKGEQCPIVALSPELSIVDHTTRWFGANSETAGSRLDGASFPRIAMLATIDDERRAITFRVANVHLDERIPGHRVTSARQVSEWLDESMPTIVLGDFNTTPDDQEVTAPLLERRFTVASLTGGTNHDFTGVGERQIDQIWFSHHWTIAAAEIVTDRPYGRLPSDHWPVRATGHL
jgi:endonuclease/exonuclease/phosphatase family metal-dependent hydrolase